VTAPAELMKQVLTYRQTTSKADLADFALKLLEDPTHFRWGDSAAREAARVTVSGHSLRALEKGGLEHLAAHAKAQALNGALYPSKSTSVLSNLMHVCTTQAWAEVLAEVEEVAKGAK
jgi:hypothetical protein